MSRIALARTARRGIGPALFARPPLLSVAIRAAAAASGPIYAVPMRQRSATFELEGPAAPQMAPGTSGTRGLPW